MALLRATKRIALAGAVLLLSYALYIGISILLLPPVKALRNSRVSFTITVRDWHGRNHPFVVGPKNRYWTPIRAIPSAMKKAVVAAEDANFYRHEGVDYDALKEAIKADIEKGKFARGGSTITQQLAKNVYLSREKTVTRKVKEIYLAHRIDDVLSKSRILELYLNVVELGPMVYGIGHASRYYFGKSASALTVKECAFLAAMLPGPKVYNPYRKMHKVTRRADRILRRMYGARMIGEGEYRIAVAEMPGLAGMARKVERTMAAPPAEEAQPPAPPVEDLGSAPASPPGPGEEAGEPNDTGFGRKSRPGVDSP
jgi:monofunctional biosynthetic peptidoglycan transglycosylase